MESKTERKNRAERLKKLSAQGMSLEELATCVLAADPKPLWEEEKAKRKAKGEEKAKKKARKSTT
ncbi:MAG: hypothetical protein HY913_20770 [Desulfomonile tiedjei]|nr:hypothetical protein [Desulfomonile tiedjei]